jgi:hypothetical protein
MVAGSILLAALLPLAAIAHPLEAGHGHSHARLAKRIAAGGAIDGGANAGFRSVRIRAKRNGNGQCKVRASSATADSAVVNSDAGAQPQWTPTSSTETAAWTPTSTEAWTAPAETTTDSWTETQQYTAPGGAGELNALPTTTSSTAAPATNTGSGASGSGTFGWYDQTCGASGADDNQPNGSQEWINCGVNGGGWTPPHVTVDQLRTADLANSGDTFSACTQFFDKFYQYGAQYGVPAMLLASFARQESGCDPNITGANGEAGLMQLASGNCAGASKYVLEQSRLEYSNTIAAATTSTSTLAKLPSSSAKSLLAATATSSSPSARTTAGTRASPTARPLPLGTRAPAWPVSRESSLSKENIYADQLAENNLDYVYQVVNGWLQGKDGHSLGNVGTCQNRSHFSPSRTTH